MYRLNKEQYSVLFIKTHQSFVCLGLTTVILQLQLNPFILCNSMTCIIFLTRKKTPGLWIDILINKNLMCSVFQHFHALHNPHVVTPIKFFCVQIYISLLWTSLALKIICLAVNGQIQQNPKTKCRKSQQATQLNQSRPFFPYRMLFAGYRVSYPTHKKRLKKSADKLRKGTFINDVTQMGDFLPPYYQLPFCLLT